MVFHVSSDLQFKCDFFRRNSNKRTKSTSYWKHCYNCPKMVHVGLHSVGTYHKKFGDQNKKKICFAECPQKTLGKYTIYRVPVIWHSVKNLLCRVSAFGSRQRLTAVSCRRTLTTLCRVFAIAVSSALHSVNCLVTERMTLPRATLGKLVFAECPIKSTQQRFESIFR
jgi:hypothetical protein